MKNIKNFEEFLNESLSENFVKLNENVRIIFSANVSSKAKDIWRDETEKKGLEQRSRYSSGDYVYADFDNGKMIITVDKKDARKVESIVGKAAGGSKIEIETQKWNPKVKKWEIVDREKVKKYEDNIKITTKKKVEELKKALGESPSIEKVANYVWGNWKKITGLSTSERKKEGHFPDEIEDILNYYKIDYTDFSDVWNNK